MAVFRVRGTRADGDPGQVDVACSSESLARSVAIHQGLRNTTSVEMIDPADAVDPVTPAPPRRPGPARATQSIRVEHKFSAGSAFRAGFFVSAGAFVFGLLALIPYALIGLMIGAFR